MSKLTNEKLQSNIASADKKIASIELRKEKAYSLIETADQDIREIQAVREGYVGLLAARGVEVETPADEEPDESEAAQDPQFA